MRLPAFSTILRLAGAAAVLGVTTLTVAIVAVAPASAVDLGVQGSVWPIIEIDIRELLMGSVARANWKEAQDKLETSAKGYFDRLPRHAMGTVARTETRWIDPSFELPQDIAGPVKNAKGDYEWRVLFAKGTRVNPLELQRPYNAMLFFDGASKAQVAFVKEAVARFPGRLVPVEATGVNPTEMAAQWSTPVFSASDSMIAKFNLNKTPSLLYPGENEHRFRLGYTTYGAPYQLSELAQSWPEGLGTSGGSRR